MGKKPKKTIHRSSKTGKIVTAAYAKAHRSTTETEKVSTGKRRKR